MLKFKKLHHDAVIPDYKTQDASGMDICAIEDIRVSSGEITVARTGIAVEIPKGFELQVRPRSGLAAQYGITVVNSPGTIDADYRGEIKVILTMVTASKHAIGGDFITNFTNLKKGDRIAQLVLAKVSKLPILVVEELSSTERGEGGFGSTGRK